MLAIVKAPRNDTFEIPTLREASREYAALCDRRTELQTKRDDLAKDAATLNQLAYEEATTASGQIGKTRADRIAKIAGGEAVQSDAAAAPASKNELYERQVAVSQQLADFNDALLLLNSKISAARLATSAIIREQIRPMHARLVADICARLIELHRANATYHQFTATCNDEQIAWSPLEPMFPRFIGGPRRAESKIADYLHSAAKNGFIDQSMIPGELRR
jgi:hypothetical protein